jgi:hypothetical protein
MPPKTRPKFHADSVAAVARASDASGTMVIAPHAHACAQTPQPLQQPSLKLKRLSGPRSITALSGRTP